MNTATVALPVSRKSPGEGVPRSPDISVQEILRSDAKPEGVPSPALGNYPQQKIVDAIQRDIEFYGKREIKVQEGETAREKIAERARERFTKSIGRDFSNLSTSEAVDLIQYQLFPNLGPWAGMGTPLT